MHKSITYRELKWFHYCWVPPTVLSITQVYTPLSSYLVSVITNSDVTNLSPDTDEVCATLLLFVIFCPFFQPRNSWTRISFSLTGKSFHFAAVNDLGFSYSMDHGRKGCERKKVKKLRVLYHVLHMLSRTENLLTANALTSHIGSLTPHILARQPRT